MPEDERTERTIERLLDKSKEAFILAIEIYNRPSIRYRVEGFAFFICNAWELMLKAKIIRDEGLAAIYYPDKPGRTKTLEQCLDIVMTNDKSPMKQNLKDIIRLRNTSTHFIVEEYEQVYIGLFQSCVINFDERMMSYHGIDMGEVVPPHFLTVSMTANPVSPEMIRARYSPEVAERFLADESEIEQEQALQANQRYSVLIETSLAVVKNPANADFTVALDQDSNKSVRVAKVFQDPHNTHPLTTAQLIEHINRRIRKSGISLKANGVEKRFTTNDWTLISKFYGMKDEQKYTYKHKLGKSETCTYSMRTVDFVMELISENPDGLIDALKREMKLRKAEQTPGAKDSKR